MALTNQQMTESVAHLRTRPGHENVRAEIRRLLVDGLGAAPSDVQLELPIPEARGRADALLGRTVFEFKRDLRREGPAAEAQLLRYIEERERDTRDRYVGIATGGAEYRIYEVRDGALFRIGEYRLAPADWWPGSWKPRKTDHLTRRSL